MSTEPKLVNQRNILHKKQLYVVYGTLASALLFSFVDQNSLAVSIPTISKDLNASSTVSWAGTSMLIANTVFQILFGRMSDIFGRKVVLIVSLMVLCLSQLAVCFCNTAFQLYIFRGFAGVGNGGITGLTMMIVSDVVTLKNRGKYQGILGACVGIGNAVGPLLSGYLCSNYGWRIIFYILCPISAIIAFITFLAVPRLEDFTCSWSSWKYVDYWGFLSSSIGTITFLVGLSCGGNTFAWDSNTVISLLSVGGMFLLIFLIVEWKVSALPVLPLRLFKSLPLAVILVQNLLFGMVYYSNLYFLPLYFELCRSWSPTLSACLNLPLVLGQAIASTLSGQLISRTGRYGFVIYIGYSAWFLGSGLQLLFGNATSKGVISIVLLIQGFGVGFVFQPTIVAAQAHSPLEDRAVVISVRNFLRSLGGSIGIAVSTTIMSNSLARLINHNTSMPDELRTQLKSSVFSIPAFLTDAQKTVFREYLTELIHYVYVFYVPLMGIVWIIGWLVRDQGLEGQEKSTAEFEEGTSESESKDTQIVVKVTKEYIKTGSIEPQKI